MSVPGTDRSDEAPLHPGALFNRYIIIEVIGLGSAGIVYAAYDPDLDRKLALKLVRTTAGRSERRRARLVREAQALARLSHPNVIPVYEVGAQDAQVFVAMEFVDGRTLRAWQDAKARSWSEILDKYLQAGRGLAAAHAADIIHRDFKPDNALVGDDERVRVLDFGLAAPSGELTCESGTDRYRPDEESLNEHSSSLPKLLDNPGPLTAEGRIMGTPAYMSPEQAEGHPTDARGDQYSFCVALWEALFGQRPKRGESARIVRGHPGASEVPTRIRKALERGLEPSPEQRFASMLDLLDTLEAKPRHTPLVLALILLLGFGLAAAAFAVLLRNDTDGQCVPRRAELAEVWNPTVRGQVSTQLQASGAPFATTTAETISLEFERWGLRWLDAGTAVCEATYVERQQSDELFDLRVACLDRQLSALAAVTEAITQDPSEAQGAATSMDEALAAVLALPAPERCLQTNLLAELSHGPPKAEQVATLADGRTLLTRARGLLAFGQYRRVGALLDELATRADTLDYAPFTAEVMLVKGQLLSQHEASAHAQEQLREAWLMAQSAGQDEVAIEASTELTKLLIEDAKFDDAQLWLRIGEASFARSDGDAHFELMLSRASGSLANARGEFGRALSARRRNLELTESLRGESYIEVADVLLNLADTEGLLEQWDSAEQHVQRALSIYNAELGPDHPARARGLDALAHLTRSQGHPRRALELEQQALSIFERAYADIGGRHRSIALTLNQIGAVYHELAEFELMRASFERTVELLVEIHGAEHPELVRAYQNLGIAFAELGQPDAAFDNFSHAERVAIATYGEDHMTSAYLNYNIGELEVERGNLETANTRYMRAEATWRKLMGDEHGLVGLARGGHAKALHLLGQVEIGLTLQREALALREGAFGSNSFELIDHLLWIGRGELARDLEVHPDATKRALEALERGLELLTKADSPGANALGQVRFALARAHGRDETTLPEAIAFAHQAELDLGEATVPLPILDDVRAWLSAHE